MSRSKWRKISRSSAWRSRSRPRVDVPTDDDADDDSDRADLAPAPVGESGGETVAALHWPQASMLSLKLPFGDSRFDDGGLDTSVLAIALTLQRGYSLKASGILYVKAKSVKRASARACAAVCMEERQRSWWRVYIGRWGRKAE
jgi:hypothetical protein